MAQNQGGIYFLDDTRADRLPSLPSSSQPFDSRQFNETMSADETTPQMLKRVIPGTVSDIVTGILGIPGNIESFPGTLLGGIQSLLGYEDTPEESAFKKRAMAQQPHLPTTEELRAKLPTQLTKRGGSTESNIRDVLTEAPMNIVGGPGGWVGKSLKALAKTATATGLGKGVEKLAGELGGETVGKLAGLATKLGATTVMAQAGLFNLGQEMEQDAYGIFHKIRHEAPISRVIATKDVIDSFENAERQLSSGISGVPSRDWALSKIREVKPYLKAKGGADINKLYDLKVSLNEALRNLGNGEKQIPYAAEPHIKKMVNSLNKTIHQWADEYSPVAGAALKRADSLHSRIIDMKADQDTAYNNISWVAHLMGGRFHKVATVIDAYKAGEAAQEFVNDPVMMHLMSKLITKGLSGSKGSIASAMNEINKHMSASNMGGIYFMS